MTNGFGNPLQRPVKDANGVLDLSALIQKDRMEGKLARAKLVIFPLGAANEWLTSDGTMTLISEGLDAGAQLIGMMPVPNPGHVGLIYTHPDWPVRPSEKHWEVVKISWQRYKVAERGEALDPPGLGDVPA